MKKAIISLSGGLDSTSLAVRLLSEGYEVLAIGFDYGQKHKIELQKAEECVRHLKDRFLPISFHKIDLTSLTPLLHSSLISGVEKDVPTAEDGQVVVPNRNPIFASLIYSAALSQVMKTGDNIEIALGIHAGDLNTFPDCRVESIEALRDAFAISNYESEKVSYITPYINFSKTALLRDGVEACNSLGIDWREVYKRTSTSYEPTPEGLAGISSTDVDRVRAFVSLGLIDPVEYRIGWENMVQYVQKLDSKN